MESKERRNAVARAVLLWLYEKDGSYPLVEDFLASSWVEVGHENVGNDELVRTVRWLHDRGLVGGPEIDQVPYPVKLALTKPGRLIAVEQDGWVEPEAATPDVASKPSVHVVARAFLLWLYPVNNLKPMPQKFLDDPGSVIAGHQVTNDEMFDAVRVLVAKEFVDGPATWGSDIPLRISLTAAGRICVVDHDGNISRRRTWDEMEWVDTAVDKSITTTGNDNIVVAHSDNVSISPDPRDRPDLVVERAKVGSGSGHTIELTMTGGPQQLHVTVDVAVLEPQEGVTATVTDGEIRRMVRGFKRRVMVTLDQLSNDRDVDIEVVARCQDVDPPHERWTLRHAVTIERPPPTPRIY